MLERTTSADIDSLTIAEIRDRIDVWMFDKFSGVVQSGPFAGMKMLNKQVWMDGALSPMLIGCHEEELHSFLEEEITRLEKLSNPKIVNIGCAEGYYSVGLARRLPRATVWPIDILKEALEITAETARANDVSLNFDMDSAFSAPDLVVSDCEGGEIDYIDMKRFPALALSSIIVECHTANLDWVEPFKKTHIIWIAYECARDPNKFAFMHLWPSAARWMAVSEGRPCRMFYLMMRPLSFT